MTEYHCIIADLLLQDDNAEVRTVAAECMGIAFQAGYPLSQAKAKIVLWKEATSRFQTSSDFAAHLLKMLVRVEDLGMSNDMCEGLRLTASPLQNNCGMDSSRAQAISSRRNLRISTSNHIIGVKDCLTLSAHWITVPAGLQ
jgi:hypothetical protein